jgi:hypothetical protein
MSEDESYIVKQRDFEALVRAEDKDALADFFEQPVTVIVESITGAIARSRKEWVLATSRIVQGAFKARLFPQVAAEISAFRKAGKIPDDYAKRKSGFQTWVELFTVIDEETPDEERLEALKAMFLAVNHVNTADAEKVVAYQLFQIAKRLRSNDLLILKFAFEMNRKGTALTSNSYGEWVRLISSNSHLPEGLVDLADETLVQCRLLTERYDTANRLQINQSKLRLTELGIKFCENLERYRIEKQSLEND